MATYQDAQIAEKYVEFLNSTNGQIQQEVLLKAILSYLHKSASVLDAGSGSGWLANALKKDFSRVEACDTSSFMVDLAKKQYPNIDFKNASLEETLPYPPRSFDFVILNMVAPDLDNLTLAFLNLASVIKPQGKLLMSIPNPGLTYPAAVWKRGLLDVILFRKPKLRLLTPPKHGQIIEREFGPVKISSHYYSLSDYVTEAQKAGLTHKATHEVKSKTDSAKFDLRYQLYRYPLFLILEFEKNA